MNNSQSKEIVAALMLFRKLTPRFQNLLIDLAEALLRSQAECDDSQE